MEKPKTKSLKLKLFQVQNSSEIKKEQENPKKTSAFTIQLQASFDLSNKKREVLGRLNDNFIGNSEHMLMPSNFQAKYEIIEEIGKGAQGVVFKVLHKETRQIYAAKFYSSQDEELINLIRKESEIISKLDHKNIVKYIDFIQDDNLGRYMIVTEYFESVTLETFLKDYKYEQKTITSIIIQLFESLQYLHQNSIIHRDLNCKNILIDPKTNFIKLIDFGVSRFCHSIEEIISPQGNWKYRVPSMFEFSRNPFIGDLWSAVIVALSVMTKKKITTKKAEQVMENSENCRSMNPLKTAMISILMKTKIILGEMEEIEDNSQEANKIKEIQECFQRSIYLNTI